LLVLAHAIGSMRGFRDAGQASTGGGPVTDLSDDPVDDDIDFALAELQVATMRQIQAAVERIESSQYGICERCDRKISAARLRALPFATRCRECQEAIDRGDGVSPRLNRVREVDSLGFQMSRAPVD
jgi:RNA polymerase-binding transcription factor DksA